MEERITLCGDDCLACPRYLAKTDEELRWVAELWCRIGWRDRVVSNAEIACDGCSPDRQCTYQLVSCTREHHVARCNQCPSFPCDRIRRMLERSAAYQKRCREVCSEQEYIALEKAFFDKENNLMKSWLLQGNLR